MRPTVNLQVPTLIGGGSFNYQWVADVYYQGVRVYANLPIGDPKFTDDGTAKVQGSGSVTVRYQGQFADSIAPRLATDMLAPFGAELAVYVLVFTGTEVAERIEMGWYRIVDNPSIEDHMVSFLEDLVTAGSTVELTLQDRFHRVQRDEFDLPGSPRSQKSVLAEMQRLSGLQLTAQVADKTIPRAIAYQQSKLDAVYDLADVLDTIPYMRPDGTLGQRPIDWPAKVGTIRAGNGGTLVEAKPKLSNSGVYNRVAVLSAGGATQTVLASTQLTTGPLRAVEPDGSPSPYGRVTYRLSSPYVTTPQSAMAYAVKWLPRVSNLRAGTRDVVELFNPLREVGDVVDVVPLNPADAFTGRILTIDRTSDPTQQMTLEVMA